MIGFLFRLKKLRRWMIQNFPEPKQLGNMGVGAVLEYPAFIGNPQNIFIGDYANVRSGITVVNSSSEKIIIKKYSVIASNVTIVPNNHRSTVKLPQFFLGPSHINDKTTDIVIEEDVWVGIGVILLAGAHLGRGCVVGAGTIVNKSVPPYAVVVGPEARIVKKKFSVEQIIEHEKSLYNEKERLSREFLIDNDKKYFEGLKVFGTESNNDSDEAMKIIERVNDIRNSICND